MEQLRLYASMRCTATIDDHPFYQRWLYRCEVDRSIIGRKAPSALFFADALKPTEQAPSQKLELRCRKCRYRHSPPSLDSQELRRERHQTKARHRSVLRRARPGCRRARRRADRAWPGGVFHVVRSLLPRAPIVDARRARAGEAVRPTALPDVHGERWQVLLAGAAMHLRPMDRPGHHHRQEQGGRDAHPDTAGLRRSDQHPRTSCSPPRLKITAYGFFCCLDGWDAYLDEVRRSTIYIRTC